MSKIDKYCRELAFDSIDINIDDESIPHWITRSNTKQQTSQ